MKFSDINLCDLNQNSYIAQGIGSNLLPKVIRTNNSVPQGKHIFTIKKVKEVEILESGRFGKL